MSAISFSGRIEVPLGNDKSLKLTENICFAMKKPDSDTGTCADRVLS